MKTIYLILTISILFLIFSCKDAIPKNQIGDTPKEETAEAIGQNFSPPTWAKTATIYEVNTRQFTKDGSLKAFEAHLPRIKKMGIDIIWFMPIYPISKKNRKGTLGSPYAVADYKAVNPELGTMEDFESVVSKIHELGMYVILDWEPNHTGWDNHWISEHPEWYTQDKNGNIIDPIDYNTGKSWGWTDVADLNYDNMDMQNAMIESLEFWVREHGVDGFRMDVAHGVPNEFFTRVDSALFKIRPMFMLAEGEVPIHQNSGNFVMSYAWRFKNLINDIGAGKKNANDIDVYFEEDKKLFKKGYHMYFTSNHDENSWDGTVFERLGEGHKTIAVLAATVDGMPLLYGGQEEPLKRSLKFFERDPIGFKNYEYAPFYTKLLKLKKRNKALWNGAAGGIAKRIKTSDNENVYAFTREKDGDKIVVILNLSSDSKEVELKGKQFVGDYTNVFTNSSISLSEAMKIQLNPWHYIVLSNK